jgi:phosphate-selective porin OprO/OprP
MKFTIILNQFDYYINSMLKEILLAKINCLIMTLRISVIALAISNLISVSTFGQDKNPLSVITKREKGIEVVQKDSLFSLRVQFRMQNRVAYMSKSTEDFTPESFEMRVRRLRLALRGFVYNPKFTYYIQLSFSRGDMDWESTNSSTINTSLNIVRDAMVFYEPLKGLKLGFGQTKLPGNRQRVVSSGNLQFADRSIVNSTFTIDRDFGLFATYERNYFRLKGAITSGEGRNSSKSDKGLNYTGRVEYLPFGKFTGDNEDWEGDLAREKKPKLVLALGYNYNVHAMRQGGTLGNDLYAPVNMKNLHADLLFKYKGFSLLQEYTNRVCDNAITVSPTDASKYRVVYTGFGSNTQLSYNFKNNIELAVRYSFISPNREIYNNPLYANLNEKRQEQWHFGVTKYLYGHRLKVQGNLVYNVSKDLQNVTSKGQFGAIFQIEMGI